MIIKRHLHPKLMDHGHLFRLKAERIHCLLYPSGKLAAGSPRGEKQITKTRKGYSRPQHCVSRRCSRLGTGVRR